MLGLHQSEPTRRMTISAFAVAAACLAAGKSAAMVAAASSFVMPESEMARLVMAKTRRVEQKSSGMMRGIGGG